MKRIIVTCLLLWSAAAHGQEVPSQPAEPATPAAAKQVTLRMLVTGEIGGHFADIDCRKEPSVDPASMHFAKQVGYIQALDALTGTETAPRPIVVDVGDLTYPGVVGRYLYAKGTPGARNLAALTGMMGYDFQAAGNLGLGAPREGYLDYVESVTANRGVVGAANLACNAEGGAERLCTLLGTSRTVVARGPVQVGLLSVVDPAVGRRIADFNRRGLDFLDLEDVLTREVAAFRAQDKPDLVVVTVHVADIAPEELVALAAKVPGIDVMLTNWLYPTAKTDTVAERGFVRASTTSTVVVDGGSGKDSVVSLEMAMTRSRDRWTLADVRAQTVSTVEMPADPQAAAATRDIAASLCGEWGAPVAADLPFEVAFSEDDFQAFALNVMRFTARVEVALINAWSFRNVGQFPLDPTLTRADVYSALPFGNRLVKARISGKDLKVLASKLVRQKNAPSLIAAGFDGKSVNGRPLDDSRLYTVVTNQFVAAGGDGLIAPESLRRPRLLTAGWSRDEPTVGDLLVHFVTQRPYAPGGEVDSVISSQKNFPDLYRKLLWKFGLSATGTYQTTVVDVPQGTDGPLYSQSQLNSVSTETLTAELKASADGEGRDHGWDNGLSLQYARARLDNSEDPVFEETKDLIRLESTYRWLYPRAESGNRWYVPIPFFEAEGESEIDKPEEREWHRLQLRGVAGVAFRIFDPLELHVGFNARQDVLQPDGPFSGGLAAGFRLKRTKLFTAFERSLEFESELDYFYNPLGADPSAELRTMSSVFAPLFAGFSLTGSFGYYRFEAASVGTAGSNREFRVGLNYAITHAVQDF